MDFAALSRRAEEFYKRLLLLSEGNLILREESECVKEIMDEEGREDRFANIAYFRKIAAKHLEESASPLKPSEA